MIGPQKVVRGFKVNGVKCNTKIAVNEEPELGIRQLRNNVLEMAVVNVCNVRRFNG